MFLSADLKFSPWKAPLARRVTLRAALRVREGFRRGARRVVLLFLLLFAIDVVPFVAATLRAVGFFLEAVLRTVLLFRAGFRLVDAFFVVLLLVARLFRRRFFAAFKSSISLIP